MRTFPPGDLYILHHLELGDCFICKGLVAAYAREYSVKLFVKRVNEATMRHLYADMDITLVPVDSADLGRKYIADHGLQDRSLVIGFENLDRSVPFDEAFYRAADVPLECKWSGFTLRRDAADERCVVKRAVASRPYVFAHLNTVRGHGHSFPLSSTGHMPIIQPNPALDGSSGVLSWLGVIEGAEWILVSNSCYLNLIDLAGIRVPRMVYCRNTPHNRQPHEQLHLRTPWEIL